MIRGPCDGGREAALASVFTAPSTTTTTATTTTTTTTTTPTPFRVPFFKYLFTIPAIDHFSQPPLMHSIHTNKAETIRQPPRHIELLEEVHVGNRRHRGSHERSLSQEILQARVSFLGGFVFSANLHNTSYFINYYEYVSF